MVGVRLEWTEDGAIAAELHGRKWTYFGPTARRLAVTLGALPWNGAFVAPGEPEYLEALRATFKQSTSLRVAETSGAS